MPWAPTDHEVQVWLAELRAAAPAWGVLYDPRRLVWLAVRGRQILLTADTPADLATQITSHEAWVLPGDPRFRLGRLPRGVVRG